MTGRERLRRCYDHEELDRPAVYSRTGFPVNDSSYDPLKALLAESTELKLTWSAELLLPPPPSRVCLQPHTDDYDRQITVIATPAGELESAFLVSRRGQPGMAERFLLKSAVDAQRYLSLPEEKPVGDTDGFFTAQREMGDRGIVDVHLGLNPAGFVAELFGSEGFALASVLDRPLLHALCQRRADALCLLVKHLLRVGVGPYFAMDGEEYLVPPLHGPEDFRDFNLRYDRRIIALIHDGGGRIHIHCHGSVRKVLPLFVEAGVDVLHPLEGPPMGDVTPAEAARLTAGRVCLEGNIQIADMYEDTPAGIRGQVGDLVAAAFRERRNLIVSPTASPYIRGAGQRCLSQYRAMIEAVMEWRG